MDGANRLDVGFWEYGSLMAGKRLLDATLPWGLKQHQAHRSMSLNEVLEALEHKELVMVVKAAQKHNVCGVHGQWSDFVKVTCPAFKLTDPARHSSKVLVEFIRSIANLGGDEPAESRKARRGQKFVKRYLAFLQQVKDEADVASEWQGSTSTSQAPLYALIQRTRSHTKFVENYSFPSYCLGWVRTRRWHCGQPAQLLALDCEMCKTDREENALLGLCLVDEHGNAVYKELVKPRGEVLDYRTHLTGVSASDLEGVTLTCKAAQRAIKRLLGANMVLVGHALHHDLNALKIDHQPVIDTSLIFSFQGLPHCTPSLRDLAKQVLGLDMAARGEGRHDSQEDAWIALQLILHELRQASPTGPLPPPQIKVEKEDLAKLFIHSIPKDTTQQELLQLFCPTTQPPAAATASGPATASKEGSAAVSVQQSGESAAGPSPVAAAGAGAAAGAAASWAVPKIEGSLAELKLHAVFKHAGDANAAFKHLPGQQGVDSMGRATKQVPLPRGRFVKIRKMACHNGLAFGKHKGAAPAASTPSSKGNRKKQKRSRPGTEGTTAAAKGGKQGSQKLDQMASKQRTPAQQPRKKQRT